MVKVLVDRSMQFEPIKWKCSGCESDLETESVEDVKLGEFGGNWAEKGTPCLYVACPICGSTYRIENYHVVPKAHRQALDFCY